MLAAWAKLRELARVGAIGHAMDAHDDWITLLGTALAPWIVAAARLPWIAVAVQLFLAMLAAALLLRLTRPALLRILRGQPLPYRLASAGRGLGWASVTLYFTQLVLEGARDDLAGIGAARHLNALLLTLVLTWLGVRCIGAVADFIIERNPAEAGKNKPARRRQTQTRVLARSLSALLVLVGAGVALSALPLMRQIGQTLLASAGVAGLMVGFAARPVLGNLLAGVQIALTQPISLGDVVIVEQEWGWVDEITGTYVVIRIWDERRLILPLQWFIEHPFQNWTRHQTAILGTVLIWVDHAMPIAALRAEAERLCRGAPEWDGRTCSIHLVEAGERALQVRVLLSAADAGKCWELRCRVREGLVGFVRENYPHCLPRLRVATAPGGDPGYTAPH